MTKINFFRVIIFIALALPAFAQKEVGIAAIVGDSVISNIDLQERIKIAMFASNLPGGKGIEEKLLPQILHNLVDERLYMKEAQSLGIEVTPDEMARVVADIEKRNSIQPGKFNDYLKTNGISTTSMMEQIKSQLTWSKVIARKVRPQITVTDQEIDEKTEQTGTEEINVSEILLTVDNTNEDKKVQELAGKLVKQLRKGGDFGKVAKQFSKASSAENGGDVGWLSTGHFPAELSKILQAMHAHEISNPIRVEEGYIILKLNERRSALTGQGDVKLGLKRAFIPTAQNITEEEHKKIESSIQKKQTKIKTCDDFTKFAKDINSTVDPQMVTTQLSALSPEVANKVNNLKIGEYTKPLESGGGLNVFMVCEKTDSASTILQRNKIREGLFMKKLEIQANRYLRELRRGAFIELRI